MYVEITKLAGSLAGGGTGLRVRYRDRAGARFVTRSVAGLYVCRRLGSTACDALRT